MTQAPSAPAPNPLIEQLKKVRASKTLELKPTSRLRKEVVGLDGTSQPLRLRYYQAQGIYHLLLVKRMVLGDGTGLGKCQVSGTMVLSSEGLVPIESFAPVSFDASTAEETFYDVDREVSVWTGRRMARVSRFYWSGKKPTIKVTTRNGYQVEGSLVHPMRVRNEHGESWRELGVVREGDFLCVDRSEAPFPEREPAISFDVSTLGTNAKAYTYPTALTPELATLLGYIVAEGHARKYGVTVTQFRGLNPEPHEEIRRLFQAVFGWEGNFNDAERDTAIKVASIGIREFLRAVGVGEELSRSKSVPDIIFRGGRESVRGFLSAIIEAEGSVTNGGVEFSSASATLARQVQLLLLRFGVISTLAEKRLKDNDHTYWRLTFFGDDARLFQELVGFRSDRKANALRADLAKVPNPNKDLVPHAHEPIRALKAQILKASSRTGSNGNRKGSGIKQFGETFQSTLKHILLGHRDPSYTWLAKLMGVANELGLSATPEYEGVLSLFRTRYFYDPVVKVERGEAEVMDIEVEDPEHCYIANGLLSHNTVQTIGFLCYLWDKEAESKAIVICPKSAIRQWASEVKKFSVGIQTFVAAGSLEERKAAYLAWVAAPNGPNDPKSILITNYHSLVRDWDYGGASEVEAAKPGAKSGGPLKGGLLDKITSQVPKLVTIFDEATAFKNPSTKTWQTCRFLSDKSNRVVGLTATLLKNNLMEGFGIYKVIKPDVFSSKTKFQEQFCVMEMQRVRGGGKVPIVVGYKNLVQFRTMIAPFFYGRAKHEVSNELPSLTTKEVIVEMTPAEDKKYAEALSGVLELGDGTLKEYEDTKALTSLIYCQQCVDSPVLLRYKEGDTIEVGEDVEEVKLGSKEQALLDLLNDEFDGEKVIVYTRFESLVGRLTKVLAKDKIKSVRITGKENDKKRAEAQAKFQDLTSDTRVVFITDAGSEAINLQAASAIIFYDSPWSWGNYVQLLGRMIRIGSPHPSVFAVHIVAERPGREGKKRETIDAAVLKTLRRKKGLIDQIIGEAAQGALKFDRAEGNGLRDLLNEVRGGSV